jgi:mannosyltransferase
MAAMRALSDDRRASPAMLAIGAGALTTCTALAWAGRPSVWYDEAATLSAIRRPPGDILRLVSDRDAVHAVYYLSAWAWSHVAGGSIVALRAWSAIGLGVTAALVCLLVDRLISRRAALWSGVVTCLLPGLAWSGLEARSYAWSAALAVLATYVFVVACDRGGFALWATYAVAATFMTWWMLFAAMMVLVHGVAMLTTERRLRGAWLWASGAAAVACLPLLILVRTQSAQLGWIHQTPKQVLLNVAARQVLIGQRSNVRGHPFYELAALGLGVLLVVAAAAWLILGRHDGDALAVPLVLAWAILPTVIVAGANLLGWEVYQSRYLTFSAPAFAIAAGAGLASLPLTARGVVVPMTVLLAVPALAALRSEDAKAGDDYLRLAMVSRTHHADLVAFARVDLRGVRIAYPAMFQHTRDVSFAASPRRSHSLWGRNKRAGQLRRASVAGHTLVLYELDDPAKRRYAARLRELGCTPLGPVVKTARIDGVVLRC